MTTEGRTRGAPEDPEEDTLPRFEKIRASDGQWYLACGEVITCLFEFLEEELTAERRKEFERHLAVCPSCRNYLSTYRETLLVVHHSAEIDEAEIPELPAHLVETLARLRG